MADILVLTAYSERYKTVAEISVPNLRSYAEKHGYQFEAVALEEANTYTKLELMLARLSGFDWVFWIDCDCLVARPEMVIDGLLTHDIVMPRIRTPQLAVYPYRTTDLLHTGAFIVRSSMGSKDFLTELLSQRGHGFFPLYEEAHIARVYQRYNIREVPSCILCEIDGLYVQGCFVVHFAHRPIPDRVAAMQLFLDTGSVTARCMPQQIVYQPTNVCTGSCAMCPHTAEDAQYMNHETWRKLLGRIQELDYRGIVGPYLHCEPLSDPLAFVRADDLRNWTKASVVFVTNGSHLLKRMDEIVTRPWIQWYVSIPTVDGYAAFTGLDLKTVTEGIITMRNNGLSPIVLSAVRSKQEASRIAETLSWLTPGVDLFYSSRDSRAGHVDCQFNELGLDCSIATIKYADYCIHPWAFVNVDLHGNVLGCCQDWSHEMIVGNIHDASFQEIYDGGRSSLLREQITNGSYRYPRCTTCKQEFNYI